MTKKRESGLADRFSELARALWGKAFGQRAPKPDQALLPAAKEGDADRLRSMLPHPAVGVADESGLTALGWAASWGQARCVELLLPHVDASQGNVRTKQSALMIAALQNRPHCIQALLPYSDPLARDAKGSTALMHAACARDPAGLEALLPYSELDARDSQGQTALMRAAREDHELCVRALLRAGADPNLVCDKGWSALMDAVTRGSMACVEELLPVSDVETRSQEGWSAADLARSERVRDEELALRIERRGLSQRESRELEGELAPARARPRPSSPRQSVVIAGGREAPWRGSARGGRMKARPQSRGR